MATYYVWSGATGTNAGTSWTNAYTAFGSAVTAATSAGDFIYVHYTHQENLGGLTTYTFGNNVNVISVNKDSSDSPTKMGINGWIGSSSIDPSLTVAGAFKVYIYGITFRHGSGNNGMVFASTDGCNFVFEECFWWLSSTASSTRFGGLSGNSNNAISLVNCTIRFRNTGSSIVFGNARFDITGLVIDSAGSAPTTLVSGGNEGAITISFTGCDLSFVTGTLVGSQTVAARTCVFSQCKLGANVTILATQSPANKSSGAAYVFDCSSGDTHTFFGYYDAFGSCVSDTGIYYTTGAAAQSWKITTTANCSYYTPFTSPFVDFYNTGTSSITPYFECLQSDLGDGAFQNNQIWAEFFVKTTSGSTQSTEYSDRMTLLGTPANQAAGAGTGSWTGSIYDPGSFKIDSGSAVTPAESGHIRGRVVVGEPSITVYVDPQIRT